MAFAIKRSEIYGLGLDILKKEVARFKKALANHALTEGVPAPTAHPVVEEIVRKHSGIFDVIEDAASPARDLAAEIDELKARVDAMIDVPIAASPRVNI